MVLYFLLKKGKRWIQGDAAFPPFWGRICVRELHTAHHNDLWWRARVWEESARDQKTRGMLWRELRRSATSQTTKGNNMCSSSCYWDDKLPPPTTVTVTGKCTDMKQEILIRHRDKSTVVEPIWIENQPANSQSKGKFLKCTRTHLYLAWWH